MGKDVGTMYDESAAEFAEGLKALADPHRLKIMHMLTTRGEMCVCECMPALGLTQSNLSFHLKTLKQAGFIKSRKSGKWVYYRLNRDTFQKFITEFAELFDVTKWPDGLVSTCCQPDSCTPAEPKTAKISVDR